MKVLITGATGFVGRHLVQSLRRKAPAAELRVTSRQAGNDPQLGAITGLDVTDRAAVRDAISNTRCTHVVHLAGVASVMAATADPDVAWGVHVGGTLNLAQAILQDAPHCAMVFVGSGQVYGSSARSGAPVDERTLLEPADDYSVTKAAADLALGAMVKRGLRCIRMRPFNHTGPGQSEAFAVPSFAMQIARIEAGLQEATMRVGNLEAERDFLDVRDIADAYALAVIRSDRLASGQIVNVASGATQTIRNVLDRLLMLSRVSIRIEQDASRMRPNDLPRIVGDASVARKLLDWEPVFSLDQTLNDLLQDCRDRVSQTRPGVA